MVMFATDMTSDIGCGLLICFTSCRMRAFKIPEKLLRLILMGVL